LQYLLSVIFRVLVYDTFDCVYDKLSTMQRMVVSKDYRVSGHLFYYVENEIIKNELTNKKCPERKVQVANCTSTIN